MVPFNLAVYRSTYTSTSDITFLVVDSIVDIIFLIDIVFNFHTSFVGNDGAVIVDEAKIRSNYLKSGFAIDMMACLPYDALNLFDMVDNNKATEYTLSTIGGENISTVVTSNIEAAASGSTYGNIFSILKASPFRKFCGPFSRNLSFFRSCVSSGWAGWRARCTASSSPALRCCF